MLDQAVPSQPPADASQSLTCTATWTVSPTGPVTTRVASGCPMEAEVAEAAQKWRFGYALSTGGGGTAEVSADFVFQPGDKGWYFRLAHDPAVKELAPSEVEVTKRVPFQLTAVREVLEKTSELSCTARFTLDEAGAPLRIETYGCPKELQESILGAGHRWRFAPPMVDGAPTRAVVSMRVSFRG